MTPSVFGLIGVIICVLLLAVVQVIENSGTRFSRKEYRRMDRENATFRARELMRDDSHDL